MRAGGGGAIIKACAEAPEQNALTAGREGGSAETPCSLARHKAGCARPSQGRRLPNGRSGARRAYSPGVASARTSFKISSILSRSSFIRAVALFLVDMERALEEIIEWHRA